MTSLLSTLGLTPSTPPTNTLILTPHYLTINFLLAHILISARPLKIYHKLDHNTSPRQDLAVYGPRAVSSGKLTSRQLGRLQRLEAAHQNCIDHFPLFAAATLFATFGGVDAVTVNRAALAYTVLRVVYAGLYVGVETWGWSYARGVVWWASGGVCWRLLWLAGRAVNAGK